ncbi:hypothetical protein [Stigmatella aurantiaca]|uniref:Conserved uncharacterized protein n=1 Tax=Stigmatella aurantiaca (strain DW4/3-1) TaxID=378806 RepID=Q08QV2_STIAD|nr:hypothetical protein [Stigmatella aurantiaca]ADO70004.1 conserved uncharacterized protein [Stigmatella aurantiaca DW4/3-1]EAU62861.1 hypothetical protein STIAU_2140 [Stigmatella aurantiaca DW4/3-1]
MSRFKRSALVAALALSACSDPVDKAAKARIFSAEDPPKVVASAAEKLPPEDVADNPLVARRILGMDAAEVTERLGPYTYKATLSYEWTTGDAPPVKVSETRTFQAGPGGVSGDFHGVLENSRDQGLEVMRVEGKVYARNRYGTFRQRLRDRGMAERTRTELTGAIRDVDSLFQGRLQLTPQGTVIYEGRTAWRYDVKLGEASEAPAVGNLPAVLDPKGGRDETTRRRLAFFEHRVPQSLVGEVLVDAETSVVLKVRLNGHLVVPAGKAAEGAELRMSLNSDLSGIGQDPQLKPPENFLPDADKPQGIADALDRFGIPRNKADGGTAGAAGPAEPEDE